MIVANRTRVPKALLVCLIEKAGRIMGAMSRDIVVQVNPSRRGGGEAFRTSIAWLSLRPGEYKSRLHTRGGWFKVKLQCAWKGIDPLQAAQNFVETCLHEWFHVLEYQLMESGYDLEFSSGYQRRPSWKMRPEEIRACQATRAAMKEVNRDEEMISMIIELAEVLEDVYGLMGWEAWSQQCRQEQRPHNRRLMDSMTIEALNEWIGELEDKKAEGVEIDEFFLEDLKTVLFDKELEEEKVS